MESLITRSLKSFLPLYQVIRHKKQKSPSIKGYQPPSLILIKLAVQNEISNIKKLTINGFTLVELLISITIVGILAGITISLIDPFKYQNRTRDTAIVTNLNKVALSTNSYLIAYNSAPSPTMFFSGLLNILSFSI